jgi:putative tryptophan/tyrosine transport system substrate-binding protein
VARGAAEAASSALVDGFHQGLLDYSLIDGQVMTIEARHGHGDPLVLPGLATELASLPVDCLVAVGGLASIAAKNATQSVPVIMVGVVAPVREGLIASLARPGGNVTGVAIDAGPDFVGKRIQLLQEVTPGLARLALIWNPDEPGWDTNLAAADQATTVLGITTQTFTVRDASELEGLFDSMRRTGLQGVLPIGGPFFHRYRARLAELAIQYQLPMIQARGESVQAGGLMSYGPSWFEVARRGGYYLARILAGVSPPELPVEQPREFDFVINLKTAQALGLTIPHHILLQATEVIQ